MSSSCFHCGEPLEGSALTARIGSREEPVCCIGCRAVAELIAGAGLSQYYEVRSAPPTRPDSTLLTPDAWDAYARPEVADALLQSDGVIDSITLGVEGLRCSACTWLIDRVLSNLDGVRSASTSAATGRVHVQWQKSKLTLADIMRAIAGAGYRPFPPGDGSVLLRHRNEQRSALRRLAVAGFGMMQVMMFAVAVYSAQIAGETIEERLLDFFGIVSMLVATPVMFYAGAPILEGALSNLRRRTIGMDLPVALALVLAYGASVYNTQRGNMQEIYFDSVTMFIFFVTLGRFVQMTARHRTTSVTDALARQMPAVAHRIVAGAVEDVPVSALAIGDVVLVRHGEALPGDGTLLEPEARLDESLLTGESTAARRARGDTVTGGTLNVGHPLRLRLTALGRSSVLAQVADLLEKAQAQRPMLSSTADAAATHFLAAVIACAAVTAIAWLVLHPAGAFSATLAVLVVACPCAFAIAMPAAVSAAIAALAQRGLLVTNPAALEALARVDRVIFDKTGTLTCGRLVVRRCLTAGGMDEDQCRRIAAVLERASEHPIARALSSFPSAAIADDVRAVSGGGVEGTVDGRRYRIGSAQFVAELCAISPQVLAAPEPTSTLVMLADEHRLLAQFELQDRIRDSARSTISALNDLQLPSEILSGDREAAVVAAAHATSVRASRAECSPEQKLAHVRTLQERCQRVLAVGDGVNDAPVLGAADVAIAMGRGTALAHASADMILITDDLTVVPAAIQLTRRMQRIVRQNLVWSAAYNFGSLPLAALGLVPPWLAALGMSLSSMLVIANAMRLLPARTHSLATSQTSGATVPLAPVEA